MKLTVRNFLSGAFALSPVFETKIDPDTAELNSEDVGLDLAVINPTRSGVAKVSGVRYVFVLNRTPTNMLSRWDEYNTKFVGANSDRYDPDEFEVENYDQLVEALTDIFGGAENLSPVCSLAIHSNKYKLKDYWDFISQSSVDLEGFIKGNKDAQTLDGAFAKFLLNITATEDIAKQYF